MEGGDTLWGENILGYATELLCKNAVRRRDGREFLNRRDVERSVNWETHEPRGARANCNRVMGGFVEEARQRIGMARRCARRGLFGTGADKIGAGQPAADCRCFWGFRAIDPFRGAGGAAKRGGAGTISEMGGWDSGNRVVTESTSVRTTSLGDIAADCRDLW